MSLSMQPVILKHLMTVCNNTINRTSNTGFTTPVATQAHSFAYEQSYIIGLLKGRAQSQIEVRRRPDGSFPFSNHQELLAVLDQAFGDPDEAGTAQ